VRAVRLQAATALSEVPPELLSVSERAALASATSEFFATQTLNADQPESHLALANQHLLRQQFEEAEAELQEALALSPTFVPAAVNLAGLYGAQGRDRDAETTLLNALQHSKQQPVLLHALGLVLVREKRMREAIAFLKEAAGLGPENPRFAYVYAIALHDSGRKADALRWLEQTVARHPYDRDSIAALELFCGEMGDQSKAREYANRLSALEAAAHLDQTGGSAAPAAPQR
jgi:Flp pilus assembly protein TadD